MRWSLATRLTAWYAFTAFVLVATAVWWQYRTLSNDLAGEDDQLLFQTLATVQAHLPPAGAPPVGAVAAGPVIRAMDDGCTTASVLADRRLPPPDCSAPADGRPRLRSWRSPDGRNWRIATLRIRLSSGLTVEALLDRWTDDAVLARYRRQLAIVLSGALALSLLLGFAIAHRGLLPLRVLTRRMARVDARSLDQQLGLNGAPPEIHALATSFDAMLGRLNTAFAALTRFSGDLAHEFRTPLHVLRQQAEIALQRARSAEEYREVIGSSLEELDRLRRLVDDTLFLANAEDPRAAINRTAVNVSEELKSVTEFMEALASEKTVTLSVSAPPDLELDADRLLFRRATVNLLANAIRHTPPGGSVEMSSRAEDGTVVVHVRDTGVGIAHDVLPRVFDRHFRGATEANRSEGSGLGLSIVRGVMLLHGGTAEIQSVEGGGTIVTLRFPAGRMGRI